MKVYKILEKEQNKHVIRNTDEYRFYMDNKFLLKELPFFEKFLETSNLFDIIRANMLILAIQNKNKLDRIIDDEYGFDMSRRGIIKDKNLVVNKVLDLPYLKYNGFKIYIPFFNVATNYVYSSDNMKMYKEPYSNLFDQYAPFLVNPFTTYGIDLFDSLFTKLVRIDENSTSVAFYDFDFNVIIIINRQGSLDNIIYLFDKHLKKPNKSKIVERIQPIIKAYYSNNLNDFIYLLYKNELISYTVFRKLCKGKYLWWNF